jgi:hypothetical protein
MKKIFLFLPGEVTHVPANAVDGQQAFGTVFVADAFETAFEFATGEAELGTRGWVIGLSHNNSENAPFDYAMENRHRSAQDACRNL